MKNMECLKTAPQWCLHVAELIGRKEEQLDRKTIPLKVITPRKRCQGGQTRQGGKKRQVKGIEP